MGTPYIVQDIVQALREIHVLLCGAFLFTIRGSKALTNIKIPRKVRGRRILIQRLALGKCRVRWLKEFPEPVVRVPGCWWTLFLNLPELLEVVRAEVA